MGKVEEPPLQIVDRWPVPGLAPDDAVFCPAVSGLPPERAAWLSILPIHDANGAFLAALEAAPFAEGVARPAYAGLCLVDPFRRPGDLFDAVARAGLPGIANLPTVSAFSGSMAEDIDAFGLGFQKELELLSEARERGLRIAGFGAGEAACARLRGIGCERVEDIARSGAPLPGTSQGRG